MAPAAARFDETLGEFILPWEAIRGGSLTRRATSAPSSTRPGLAGAPAVTD